MDVLSGHIKVNMFTYCELYSILIHAKNNVSVQRGMWEEKVTRMRGGYLLRRSCLSYAGQAALLVVSP